MLAGTYHRLPHEILAPLVPELAGIVTPLDWYLFDVEAANRFLELRRQANEDALAEAQARSGYPASAPRTAEEARDALRRKAGGRAGRLASPPVAQAPSTTGTAIPRGASGTISIMGQQIAPEIPPWDPHYRGEERRQT